MSCLQITAVCPTATVKTVSSSSPLLRGASFSYATRLTFAPLRLAANVLDYKLRSPVCLFGGKGKPGDTNEVERMLMLLYWLLGCLLYGMLNSFY